MKSTTLILVLMVIIVSISSTAFAQFEPNDQSKIGVRFSLFSPSDSILSDIGGVWGGPIIDYNLTFDRFERPSTMVSFGWFGKDSTDTHTRAKMMPLTFSYIKRFGADTDNTWYVGANAGAYFTSFKASAGFRTIEESGMQYGLGVTAGRDFGSAWFAEVSYNRVSSLDVAGTDIGFGGLMLSVGTRMAY